MRRTPTAWRALISAAVLAVGVSLAADLRAQGGPGGGSPGAPSSGPVPGTGETPRRTSPDDITGRSGPGANTGGAMDGNAAGLPQQGQVPGDLGLTGSGPTAAPPAQRPGDRDGPTRRQHQAPENRSRDNPR